MASARYRALQQARSILAEHFDHGLILVTWEEKGKPMAEEARVGNIFAQEGLARNWIDAGCTFHDDEEEEADDEDKRSDSWRDADGPSGKERA